MKFTALAVMVSASMALAGTVSGRVADGTTGQPLIGASVNIEGTQLGVLTDAQGEFNLEITNEEIANLRIRYVGYEEIYIQMESGQSSEIRMNSRVVGETTITVSGTGIVTTGVVPSSVDGFRASQAIRSHNISDLSDLLSTEFVEMNMIRKSGYGNEISLRGFGQSELRTTLNGGLLEGGCGSRKDPALSLISMMNIENVTIKQGPFDVTVPGALGGTVDVSSRSPEQGFNGDVLGRFADTNAPSGGITLTGGSDLLRVIAGYHYSVSGQYADGGGHSLTSFRDNTGRPYISDRNSLDAFSREDIWGMIELLPGESHVIRLEHSFGLGKDILTPRAGMDIEEETTNLSRLSYEVSSLGDFSRRLNISLYRNAVEHRPFDEFRELVGAPQFHRHNEVESVITGLKIENVTPVGSALVTFGADGYYRDWSGDMFRDDTGAKMVDLIPDVQIANMAGYIQLDTYHECSEYGGGIRVDHLETEANEPLVQSSQVTATNDVTNNLPSGFVYFRHDLTGNLSWYTGAGHSVRFPTGVERYLQSPSPYFHGNPDLEPSQNTEFDLGVELEAGAFTFSGNGMFSDISNYIYQCGKKTETSHQTWTNIDAHIYGGNVTMEMDLADSWQLHGGAALYRGIKDSQPDEFNTDRDLANMAPLKTQVGLYFSHDFQLSNHDVLLIGSTQWVHSEEAKHVDEDTGEQTLSGWNTGNIKIGFKLQDLELHLGIDNFSNEEYAVANSYEWDVVAGDGASPTVINEPGRSFFINLGYSF